VVAKDATAFFQTAMLGSNRAIAELGVVGTVVANDTYEDVEEKAAAQVALTQPYIDQGYQGVALAPISDLLTDTINGAVTTGIPVVTFDSDMPDSNRQFYLGTNNSAAGTTAGETLVSQIGNAVGTVIVYGHTESDWIDGYNRTMAATAVIEEAGHTVVHQGINWVDGPGDATLLAGLITEADPPVVGMIGMFSNAFLCGDAAVAAGVAGNIKIIAFDFDADTLQYLQTGIIQATHVQRQYYMGYLAPYILYAANVLGIDATKALLAPMNVGPGLYDTGLDVITAANMQTYNEFLDALGILN
jgi:ribose transport system substrate-binding protein